MTMMTTMTRRQALGTTLMAAAACATAPHLMAQNMPTASRMPQAGPFVLPSLPYPADALEPYIDARTMEIHHDKHHAGYVSNLNKAVQQMPGVAGSLEIESLLKNLDALPDNVRSAIRNNGGGHYNHSLFWQMMRKNGGGKPSGELGKAIDKSFGSFDAFKEQFAKAALGQFGSGWAWLTRDGNDLKIESTANQDSPLSRGAKPLLGIDVWEHAYYLKYQNKRADYVNAWWNIVNWDFVQNRFA